MKSETLQSSKDADQAKGYFIRQIMKKKETH